MKLRNLYSKGIIYLIMLLPVHCGNMVIEFFEVVINAFTKVTSQELMCFELMLSEVVSSVIFSSTIATDENLTPMHGLYMSF